MKTPRQATLTISISLLLVIAVLLSGAHAKDVARASAADHGQVHQAFGDDPSVTVKVGLDLHLHNHVEKQASSSLVNLGGDQGMHADNRSLRMPVHKKVTSRHWQHD